MQLSRENGFFDVGGNEMFIKKGVLYADDDPAVKALPGIFDKVSDDAPPKGKVQAAVSAARGKAQADG
jgi:hypothetical protein